MVITDLPAFSIVKAAPTGATIKVELAKEEFQQLFSEIHHVDVVFCNKEKGDLFLAEQGIYHYTVHPTTAKFIEIYQITPNGPRNIEVLKYTITVKE